MNHFAGAFVGTYSEFSDKMLIALYQETERTGQELHSFGDLIDRYGLEWKEDWIARVIDEWEHGFARRIHKMHAPSRRAYRAALSAQGSREVERRYGDKGGVGEILVPVPASDPNFVVTDAGEHLIDEQGNRLIWGEDPAASDVAAIDSAGWTGIAKRLDASPAIVEGIRAKVHEIDALIEASRLTNAERMKAKAISAALINLVASPEPEWKVIVDLLKSPVLGGIANLGTIIGWVVGAIIFASNAM